MRPLMVFSDVTVDGFMAGPDNDLDFLADDPRLEEELTGVLMRVLSLGEWGRRGRPSDRRAAVLCLLPTVFLHEPLLFKGKVGLADDDVVQDLDAYGLSGLDYPGGHGAVLAAGLDLP